MTTLIQLYDIAVSRLERGALSEAEHLFLQILDHQPDHPNVMHRLAQIAIEQHRYDRAVQLLSGVTVALPDLSSVLTDLGRAYMGLKRTEDAITCLERASILTPDNARIERFLADAFFAMGRFDRAIQAAEKAVQLDPTDARAHASLGDALLETRQIARAIDCYDRSLAVNLDNWKTHANRGMAFLILGRLEEAKRALIFSNALNPLQPQVALPLATVLIDLCEYQEAGLVLNKLAAMMPKNAQVLLYTGINAFKQGDTKSAIGSLIQALSIDEDNPAIEVSLGEALLKEGRFESTISFFSQIIEKNSDHLPVYIQKAKAELLTGALDEGFETIEAMQSHMETNLSAPLWDGSDLTNKTILLYSQFGLDELNVLVRFAQQIKLRGATVLVECTAPVRFLVAAMDAVAACYLPGEAIPPIDCHSSLERLPRLLHITKEDIAKTPCFSPDPLLVDNWAKTFAGITKTKIGIMWRKETRVQPDIYCSVPLKALAPLAALEEVQLISLQTHCGLEELKSVDFGDQLLHRVDLENALLDERLACLAAIDLFITPDTLTAQIASAAGLRVWILLGTVPEWHYGLNADRSIWHPTARLFRQSKIGEWDDVVAAVVAALRNGSPVGLPEASPLNV